MFIENRLNDLFESKTQIEQKVNKQSNILKQNTIANILTKKIIVKNDNIQFLADNDLQFSGKKYTVLMFDVLVMGLMGDDGDSLDSENNNMARYAISNVFSELISDVATAYYCDIEDMYACVINFNDEKFDNAYLFEKAKEASAFFKSNFNLELICVISQSTNDLEKLSELFNQTKEIMTFRFLDQNDNVIMYDDVMHNIGSYKYTLDMETQFINLLTLGDYDKSIELVQNIFNANLKNEKINLSMLRILISEIISTILKAIAEIDKDSILDTKPICTLTVQLNNVQQLPFLQTKICEFIFEICQLSNQQNKMLDDGRSKSIKEYINIHYADPNLNVSNIAYAFGLTLNYISSCFKKEVGEGMADYIVRYRIEKAKELLRGQDKAINQISQEVGFYTFNIFIRAFKKIEGITPGQYRKHFSK